MSITVNSTKLDINPKTFQPILTVEVSIGLTLETMQNYQAGGNPSESYEQLGKSLVDAIRESHKIK